MRHIGLELDGVLSARGLFTLLDFDRSGAVDIDEFIFGIARLKGYAKSLDLARLVHVQRGQCEQLNLMIDSFNQLMEVCRDLQSRVLYLQSPCPVGGIGFPPPPLKHSKTAGSAPRGAAPVLGVAPALPGSIPGRVADAIHNADLDT
eukprot:gnl/MRDRNA2_/MRDRNA2_54825_c0_seq2.p1 gnl/MRDRNA2_/MRDRNA2_54825_c0~~gnl/MRDRNA2_/MRDRNA2_54825_c0_seq2.p1  ORF type:complete len:147 (+),score=19.56 gnl/MRDRNA2_/MRDRNA2_54825_c0_seq2:95-535(+)